MSYDGPKFRPATGDTPADRVERANGSYRFPGEVRGAFRSRAGRWLYAVEHLTEPGLIHLFRESDLKPLEEKP